MTPAQARAFHAVAVEGSFTAAARLLNLSQPTLTNQVKVIETRYKVELFHRTSRGVRLTETGTFLLAIVRRMFGSYEEAVSFLEDVHGMRQGHLRVGAYGPYDVNRVLARFVEQFPGVQISTVFANSDELARRLSSYDVDVAVLSLAARRNELQAVPLCQPRLIVIAPRSSTWANRTTIRPSELADHTLIVREPGSEGRLAFEKLLLEAGVSRAKFFEFASREGVIGAVAAGLGLSAIFDEGFLPEDKIVQLAISGVSMRSNVQVACLKERCNNGPIRAFMDMAKEMDGT